MPSDPSSDALRPHHDWGAVLQQDGSTRFRTWAPSHESLTLELDCGHGTHELPMTRDVNGFFETSLAENSHGTRYRFRLPTGKVLPDPASRFQPDGVHGWSQVVDPAAWRWHDASWRGVATHDLIIYELHLGGFTSAGTCLSAIERLDELVDLGVTAIELMPIAQSAGERNWGYDGVGLFAPHWAFGTPDELRQLVDAAHNRGLAVLLDVVYNHFGPEGNYWGELGPWLSTRHSTPWGAAPNFDGDSARPLRDFFIANAIYWLDDFHLDGLRLDAAHCIHDESDPHVIAEIARAVWHFRSNVQREIHLIAESNVFDPDMLKPLENGGLGCDALWCDDFMHSVFAILRPGDHMSAREYHPHSDFDATLRRGFVFQGSLRQPRRRIPLEESTGQSPVPLESLVCAIQNHDFIGNHPQGRRLHQLTSIDAQKAAAALLLLYPAMPMLFMGEEFACDNPFFFFVDFGDELLREAVEQGRRQEYPQHDWTDVESPMSLAAFERSRIGAATEGDREMIEWYRKLIAIRRQWRAAGRLRAAAMSASWNEEGHFAWLTYGTGADQWFLVARLHPAGEFPRRVHVSGITEVVLQNHCESSASTDKDTSTIASDWVLGEFGVLAGRATGLHFHDT